MPFISHFCRIGKTLGTTIKRYYVSINYWIHYFVIKYVWDVYTFSETIMSLENKSKPKMSPETPETPTGKVFPVFQIKEAQTIVGLDVSFENTMQ